MVSILIRFPRNPEIAKKWNIALGIDSEKIVYGFVCFEHFEDKHFKRKNKTELKPEAVPIISMIIDEAVAVTNSTESIESKNTQGQFSNNSIEFSSSQFTDTVDSCTNNANNATELISDCEYRSEAIFGEAKIADCQLNLNSGTCEKCAWKDQKISEKEDHIQRLRKELKNAKNKIYYLENTKRKLTEAFSELKQQQLINEEISKNLEV